MFITNSHRGYTRDGQQHAAGRFLILFSHNQYKWGNQDGKPWSEFPKELSRKLYAHVCYVSMKQLGHFMMGESRTLQVSKAYGDKPGPNNLILSGTYGGDGLTCDYEDLTDASRAKLVEVPIELANKFWNAGKEAYTMRNWAIATFGKGKRK